MKSKLAITGTVGNNCRVSYQAPCPGALSLLYTAQSTVHKRRAATVEHSKEHSPDTVMMVEPSNASCGQSKRVGTNVNVHRAPLERLHVFVLGKGTLARRRICGVRVCFSVASVTIVCRVFTSSASHFVESKGALVIISKWTL